MFKPKDMIVCIYCILRFKYIYMCLHRFKDMDKYMRQKGYGVHAVGYFKVQ